MKNPDAIARGMEAAFERICAERMDGVPILNPALSVAMMPLREWNGFLAGVLVTPWFINAVLVAAQDDTEHLPPGTKRHFALPAGAFEFIRSVEDGIGGFWMCSLFSPVLEFADHETACAVAEACFAALMDVDAGDDGIDEDMQRIWRGEHPGMRQYAPAEDVEKGFAVGADEGDDRDPQDRERGVSRRSFLTAGQDRGEMA